MNLCAASDNNSTPSQSTFIFARKCFSLQVLCKAKRQLSFLLAAVLALVPFPVPTPTRSEQLHLPFPELVISETVSPYALPPADTNLAPAHPGDPRTDEASQFVGRVLNYLYRQEELERDPHLRSDLRIAWCLTLYSWRGDPNPELLAWRAVLNMRPDEVWPSIVKNRKQKLGAEFADWYTPDGLLKPEAAFSGSSSPKKPVQSVRDSQQRRSA